MSAAGSVWKGVPYPFRRNSLNLFRLVLAAAVLFAHSWYIVGRGTGPQLHGENLGGWAVAGFFVLSGFLITRSRIRTGAGEYLLHRIARIYPAFFVCLVATAVVFAPLAQLRLHGSLDGYLSTPVTPLEYVWGNLGLNVVHYGIGGSLDTVPYPDVWNGSLWTLYFEFLSYLVIWILGGWALYRRSLVPAVVIFVGSVVIWANMSVADRLGLDVNFTLLFKLLPFFLGGSVVYFIVERHGVNRWIALIAIVTAAIVIVFVPGWGGQAASPFIAYGLLFLATVIPQPSWTARNDISYGFYIYAWPVQQLFIVFGASVWGMGMYLIGTAVTTALLAAASWFLVERACMRRVRPHAGAAAAIRAPSA